MTYRKKFAKRRRNKIKTTDQLEFVVSKIFSCGNAILAFVSIAQVCVMIEGFHIIGAFAWMAIFAVSLYMSGGMYKTQYAPVNIRTTVISAIVFIIRVLQYPAEKQMKRYIASLPQKCFFVYHDCVEKPQVENLFGLIQETDWNIYEDR